MPGAKLQGGANSNLRGQQPPYEREGELTPGPPIIYPACYIYEQQ